MRGATADTLPDLADDGEIDPTKVAPPPTELLRAARLSTPDLHESGVTLARRPQRSEPEMGTDPLVSAFYTRSIMEDALQDAETLEVEGSMRAAVVEAVDARAAARARPRVFIPLVKKSDLRFAFELVLGLLAVGAIVLPALYWLFV